MFREGMWWLVPAVVVLLAAFAFRKSSRRQRTDSTMVIEDTGSAIVTFAQAYPDVPVRDVRLTVARDAAFVRGADGAVGLVRTIGSHSIARLLQPDDIIVEQGTDNNILQLRFVGESKANEPFVFSSIQEAAEVSLWLCANMLPPKEP